MKELNAKIESLFEKIIILEAAFNSSKEIIKSNLGLIKIIGGVFVLVWSGYAALLAYTYNTQKTYETERFNARNEINDQRFDRIFQQLDRIEQENHK
jgi:hypothetical protein